MSLRPAMRLLPGIDRRRSCPVAVAARPVAGAARKLGGADDFVSRFWDRLDPSWAARLREVWERESTALGPDDPAAALDRLRRTHEATARVDLGRVHPSWWIRALQEESPAVQRVVAASAPAFVGQPVRDGLLLDSQDLAVERSINPEVLGWALALWTERLVGGEPERPDDPPAILVLSRLSPRAGYRLCHMTGIAKGVLAGQDPGNIARARRIRRAGSGSKPDWQASISGSGSRRRVTFNRSPLPKCRAGIMRRGSGS